MNQTKDYEIFKKMIGNRPIVQTHVQQLVESIEKNNLLPFRPILVNESMEVLDGQHRLEAAKRLGIPIYYTKSEKLSIEDVALINTNQRNWKMETFLDVYANHIKNENYLKLKNWLDRFKFSLNQGIAFFMEEGNILEFRNSFKAGEFIFDEKFSNFADPYCILIKKLESFHTSNRRDWRQQGFVRAFIQFYGNPEIEQKRFWEQVDKYSFILTVKRTKQEYLEMLYEVYNYRRHVRVDL